MKIFYKTFLLFIIVIITIFGNIVNVVAFEEFEITNGVLTKYNGTSNIVDIPSNVWKIGDSAFENNSDIITLNLNENISTIGNSAFYNCTSLQNITNTSSIVDIGAYAFYNTAFVNRANQDFVSINNILIKYNGSDMVVNIPSNIESIAPYVFANNLDIFQVNIDDNVFSIGEGAFYNCCSLVKANISKKVESIGALAFANTVWIDLTSQDFVVVGNGILIKYNGTDSNINVPNDVKQICDGAFYNNSIIRSVVVNDGCVLVGLKSFANCDKLVRVELPNSVIGINSSAFDDSNNAKIIANEGSFAYNFADRNNMIYEDMFSIGDVNLDTKIDSQDATLILQYYAGIMSVNNFDLTKADVNGDKCVNSQDATLILQFYAGICNW